MALTLSELILAFPSRRVTVLGDAMLDVFLHGTSSRLCREAPVPAVDVHGRIDAPGGAANTAANVRALGAAVRFLAVLGDDDTAAVLRRELRSADVDDAQAVTARGRTTLSKQRVLSSGQILLRVDQGDTGAIPREAERRLVAALREAHAWSDVLIVSDYGYGTLSAPLLEELGRLQAEAPRVLVIDAKDGARYHGCGVTAVKPNYDQAIAWLGAARMTGAARAQQIAASADDLLELTGAELAAVTLDADGAVVVERGRPPYRAYARPERHARTTGAGDTFVAAFALALGAGADTPGALELASSAAAVVVGKDETARCSAFELRQRLFAADKPIHDLRRLAERMEYLRRQGRRIVFTNGCFDILHRGHVAYLNRAKTLGDVLVVGLNSDESVRRLKGPARPVNTLHDRLQVLAALSCVDHIVPFEEDTPERLIRQIRPHVFVKGGDYTPETLPEAPLVRELGGTVQILPLVPDRSTSGIIARIRDGRERQVPSLEETA
jgi:D-beta-D-heptose 7-phosphate kinase/D-beta-D-heptose 1-phosphate adenosyltransferase